MPCGSKPVIKTWENPRSLRVIKASRYEKNEASVKKHWKNVVKDLEASYKDEKFWETNSETVRGLVGQIIFERLAKIFFLPLDTKVYQPRSETTIQPSEEFYTAEQDLAGLEKEEPYAMSDMRLTEEIEEEGEESEEWSVSSDDSAESPKKSMTSAGGLKSTSTAAKSGSLHKSASKMVSMSHSRFNRSNKSLSRLGSRRTIGTNGTYEELAYTDDDVAVNPSLPLHARSKRKAELRQLPLKLVNPHFEMLYCNESETDMIKWNSKYKQKKFEISASDEYSKKAELLTKQIAYKFYEWWDGLGALDFKSEIKRPQDIEELFQIWFDEHASRGLVLDPKILPCVQEAIANYVGAPETSCLAVLNRMIALDIEAETKPEHTTAFNTCLPLKLKHLSPQNNTKEVWHAVRIPEDLRTMSCVWGEITHITSTKAFRAWLLRHPDLPMPQFLKELGHEQGRKKSLFMVPSDFVAGHGAGAKEAPSSTNALTLPVSQFKVEVKDVLSKLMD